MIQITRDGSTIAKSYTYSYTGTHMGAAKVTATVQSREAVDFIEGDMVMYENEEYYLNYTPTGDKSNDSVMYVYTLEFEHIRFVLGNIDFLDYVPEEDDSVQYYTETPTVCFWGDVSILCGRIIANLEKANHYGWSFVVDDSVELEDEYVSVSEQTCLEALALINSQFEIDFWYENKTIYVGGTSQLIDHTFQYGKNNGLYSINRTAVTNDRIITRLRAYGSDRNLPEEYNWSEDDSGKIIATTSLLLPQYREDGVSYIDSDNIDLDNIKEGSTTFEDIYPSIEEMTDDDGNRIDEVVAVGTIANGAFTISIRDFLGAQEWSDTLASGETPEFSFTTGRMAGVGTGSDGDGGFEMADNGFQPSDVEGADWDVTLLVNYDNSSFPMPSSDENNVAAGDYFVILNIYMPDTYVTSAEARLEEAAWEYLAEHDTPKVTYAVGVAEEFIARNSITLKEGYRIPILDEALGVDAEMIIQAITISYDEGASLPTYSLTISDEVVVTNWQKTTQDLASQAQSATIAKSVNIVAAKRSVVRLRALTSIALDGNNELNGENLAPNSVTTGALAVGTKSNNFLFRAGIEVGESSVTVPAGELIHLEDDFAWEDDNTTWVFATQSVSLPLDQLYYLGISCNRNNNSASLFVSDVAIMVDLDDTTWRFQWGVIFQAEDGVRQAQKTCGSTWITGDMIYTGIIQDLAEQNYINLTDGTMNFGTTTDGISWDGSDLRIRGALSVSPSGTEMPIGVYRGTWDSETQYYVGDEVYYGGSSYICLVDGIGDLPTGSNWELRTSAGEDGTDGTDGTDGGKTYTSLDEWTVSETYTSYSYVTTQSLSSQVYPSDVPDGSLIVASDGSVGISEYKDEGYNVYVLTSSITDISGADGNYTEYRYAQNGSTAQSPTAPSGATPSGWTVTPPTLSPMYSLWRVSAEKTAAGALVSSWSDPIWETQNAIGSITINTSETYSSTETYTGSSSEISVVTYSGTSYFARPDVGDNFGDVEFSGHLPTDLDYWCPFAASFSTMSAGLVLASRAVVENLVVRTLETAVSGARVTINEDDNTSILTYDDEEEQRAIMSPDQIASAGFSKGNIQSRTAVSLDESVTVTSPTNTAYTNEYDLFEETLTAADDDYIVTTPEIIAVLSSNKSMETISTVKACYLYYYEDGVLAATEKVYTVSDSYSSDDISFDGTLPSKSYKISSGTLKISLYIRNYSVALSDGSPTISGISEYSDTVSTSGSVVVSKETRQTEIGINGVNVYENENEYTNISASGIKVENSGAPSTENLFAGEFSGLKAHGLYVELTSIVATTATLKYSDSFVSICGTAATTITLPANDGDCRITKGLTFTIHNISNYTVTLLPNNDQVLYDDNTSNTSLSFGVGRAYKVTFLGYYSSSYAWSCIQIN